MSSPILKLENVAVSFGGKQLLNGISLEIVKGEQWVILGPSGAGKTVLAHTIAGKYFFTGNISGPSDNPDTFQKRVIVVDHHHRFKNLNNRQDFYYQQRYNSYDASETISVADDLADYRDAEISGLDPEELIDLFLIRSLLPEPLIQLSNGENKRLQIVKALLTDHDLLILDQPFAGLDAEGRILLSEMIDRLSGMGEQMILITSTRDIPACISQVAMMDEGRILRTIKPNDLLSAGPAGPFPAKIKFPSSIRFDYADFKYAVRFVDVNIRYEKKSILQHIFWEIEKGSCWSLSGPNGAGKSTLLSLITGDNPQAYANEIYLFDRRRGTGESIWEIKQKTGIVSPELHTYFDPGSTAFTAIASGFWDTIGLFRRISKAQTELADEWLDFLGLSNYRDRLLSSLPEGVQRMLLLGRAMIKTPPLVVLDEPCQGLDAEHIERVKNLVSSYCEFYEATLIYVSHYSGELPGCIQQFLRLEKGNTV